ncbi:phage tail protein I [Chitinimonas arctica]|uniref:Phage tail protein I n=1 Tax=Chitinimonas arctica TaxID=2594795 RepID=A0A516S9W1_9NEIS|nr:phage tail protein I [Chitinimonas arctica]QDQ24927.1 phage tail protein I [Chitinimonas arctica]
MSAKLLPSNATALERAVADSTASPLDPSVLRTLWSADHCPAPLLPYLAWAMSVDGWAYALTDAPRRQLIRESLALHRKKGTPWAIQRALGILGFAEARLIEHPPGAHWAEFDVQLMLRNAEDQAAVGNALNVIALWKPERSHLRRLAAIQQVSGTLKVAAATCLGETSRVMPYQLRRLSAPPLLLYLAATTTLVEVLRIRPRGAPLSR